MFCSVTNDYNKESNCTHTHRFGFIDLLVLKKQSIGRSTQFFSAEKKNMGHNSKDRSGFKQLINICERFLLRIKFNKIMSKKSKLLLSVKSRMEPVSPNKFK